ncbi:MAG: flagellar basal body rod protein FlgB [Lachnospiraceae bacterium]
MISSGVYNYVNVLDKAADASWKRGTVLNNNIANVDTPGYKRQDVNFESLLKAELGSSKYRSVDEAVSNVELSHLNAQAYTDASEFSYRQDKNNVDIDTENVELASEQIRYQALTDSITQEFNRMKTVLS